MWPVDPGTGQVCGQIEIKPFNGRALDWSEDQVDAVFYSMVSDLTGVPKELIDTGTGEIVGYSKQTLFGERQWFGDVDSPLLFAGQYEDLESGWVYNRYRYYNAKTGAYNAQDPLGLRPNIASPQAYVTNPTTGMDALGLEECSTGGDIQKNREQGKEVEKLTADDVKEQLNAYNKNVDDPLDELHMVEQLPIQTRVGDQVIASDADILIYDKRGNSRILELKSGGASLSPNQRIMRDITELTAVRDKLEDDLKEAEEELKKPIEKGTSEESIAEAKKTVDMLKANIDSELEKVHKYDKDLEKRIAVRSRDKD